MPVSRRLVAVVFADIAGYSRLMEHDEAGTHERLRTLHDELIAPKIAEHGGRTVHTASDGMFPSTTSALRVKQPFGPRRLSNGETKVETEADAHRARSVVTPEKTQVP